MKDDAQSQEQKIAELQKRIEELKKENKDLALKGKLLHKERSMLHSLIDNMPDCNIFLKDRESRFIITNAFHIKALGAGSLNDIVGRTDFDFFPRELAEQYFKDEQEVIYSGNPLIDREEKMVDSEGNEYWLLTTKIPLFAEGDDSREKEPVGLVGLSRDITRLKKLENDRGRMIIELKEALSKIRTLSGLLPICSSCKKIRDDEGSWNLIDEYIRDHSTVEFSHSMCPECAQRLYPNIKRSKEK